ncbi:MAG: helix-turn-helix domain-containing protein [Alphaproteobacteria bacterium]
MTPFGVKIREIRKQRNISQKKMADDLGVSAAYLSALEHGKKGKPGPGFIKQICGYFDIIWEEADEIESLVSISDPRVVIDTSGLSPYATIFANLTSKKIDQLSIDTLITLINIVKDAKNE